MRIIISVCLCDYVFVSFTLDTRGQGTSEWRTMKPSPRGEENRIGKKYQSITVKVSEYISVMMIRMIMMLMGPDDNCDDGVVIETMIFQIVADEICADLCMFKAG